MIRMSDIYQGASRLLEEILRQELRDQGHTLTGNLEDSLRYEVAKEGGADVMRGLAADYSKFVQDGFPAGSASMKQFPFVVRYFQQRGLPEEEAKRAAAATIKVWMQQGMPSLTSKRFSRTGSRTDFVLSAFTGSQPQINQYMLDAIDFGIQQEFRKTKTVTV